MPPVVVTVAAAYAAMSAFEVIMTLVMLASVAYSAYMMASMETPKEPDANKRNQTVRSSVQPHRMIYGECMTGGALIYAQSHDSTDSYGNIATLNGYITLVVAFTGHQVEEISEIWLNDKISTDGQFTKFIPAQPEQGYKDYTRPNGSQEYTWVVTRPAVPARVDTFATIEKYCGTPDQEASPFLCSLPPKPTTLISQKPESGLDDLTVYSPFLNAYYGTYTGQGMCIFTITITATGTNDTFKWTQQKYAEDGTTLTETASGTMAMNGTIQELTEGVKIAFGQYQPNKNFIFSTTGHSIGQTWEIRAFDGAPWTPAHRLQGRSYVVVTLENNETAFPNGLPNIRAKIKGNNQIYDPRTGTVGYSDNWALCVLDYLCKPYGLGCIYNEDINIPAVIAAANICDELVETREDSYHRVRGRIVVNDVTYQKRYTLNGSFTVDKTPTAIMSEILATAYGAITWTQGQYRILPAAYYSPDPDFRGMNPDVPGLTECDLRGPIKVRSRASMKDRFNAVKGTYISPETWQPVDFPIVRNALYKAEDGGEEITRDIQLTYITDPRRAQRIAKIMLEKSRQGITVDFPAKWSAFPLAVGDNVPVTIAQLGWDQKIFTVKDWKLNPEGGVDLQLQEEAEECYAWNSGDETVVDVAPDTILPDPRYVPAPTGLAVAESLYAGNVASVIKVKAAVRWDDQPAAAGFILTLDGQFYGNAPAQTTLFEFLDLKPGEYTFGIRAFNSFGVESDTATVAYTVEGKTAPPANVTGFAVTRTGNRAALSWNAVAGFDVDHYELRVGNAWETAQPLTVTQGLTYDWNLAAYGNYTVLIKAVDTTGNCSAVAASVTVVYAEPTAPKISGLVASTLFNNIILQWTNPAYSQLGAVEVWRNTSNSVGTATKIGSTTGTVYADIPPQAGTTYYYWVRIVTGAGNNGPWSDPASGASGSAATLPADFYTIMRTDFIVKDVRFWFGDSPYADANKAVLHWDGSASGAIIRGSTTYTLSAATGTFSAANGKYVIATLNKSAHTATFSLADISAGVPTMTDNSTQTVIVIGVTSTAPPSAGSNNVCYVRQANSMEIEAAIIRNLTVEADAIVGGALAVGGSNGVSIVSTITDAESGQPTFQIDTAGKLTCRGASVYGDIHMGPGSTLSWSNIQDPPATQSGNSVFVTYHNNPLSTPPATPTGDGTTGGWHLNSTSSVVWMSQKTAAASTEGVWGAPIPIKGAPGASGVSAVTCVLTRDSHSVPCDAAGTPTSYANSGTDIYVLEGPNTFNCVSAITSIRQFTVSAVGAGITPGAVSTGTGKGTVAAASGMTTNPATITYTVNIRQSDGTDIVVTKVQTFSKAIQGVQGPPGPTPDMTAYMDKATFITDIGPDHVFTGKIAADNILGNTITGKTFQTVAATGNPTRAMIDSSDNSIKFFESGSATPRVVIGTHDAGYGTSYGNFGHLTAGNSIGGINTFSDEGLALSARSNHATAMAAYGYGPSSDGMYVQGDRYGIYANGGVAGIYGLGYGVDAIVGVSNSRNGVSGTSTGPSGAGVLGTNNSNGPGVQGNSTSSYGLVGANLNGNTYDIYAAGAGSNYGPFTGAHDVLLAPDFDGVPGDIVCDSLMLIKRGVSNTLGVVTLSSTAKSSAVIGVVAIVMEQNDPHVPSAAAGEEGLMQLITPYSSGIVNALGEGLVNVCREGGDIAAGDLICSSSVPGKGMRQDDDLLHSYTVAKARESVIWAEGEDDIRQIACTYHCG